MMKKGWFCRFTIVYYLGSISAQFGSVRAHRRESALCILTLKLHRVVYEASCSPPNKRRNHRPCKHISEPDKRKRSIHRNDKDVTGKLSDQ